MFLLLDLGYFKDRLEPTEKYRTRKFSLNRERLYASYEPNFLLKILLNL
ncbi:MAG: hypothetical protein LBL76_05890 [Treponema sp.]|nr:hypothetical protein [Treponema sp.]